MKEKDFKYTEKEFMFYLLLAIFLTFIATYFTFHYIIVERAKMYFVCECYDEIMYNITIPAKIFR